MKIKEITVVSFLIEENNKNKDIYATISFLTGFHMSSKILIAVGYRCFSDSEFAQNTPYSLEKFPIGKNDEEVLVGASFKSDHTCNAIDLTDFNKNEVLKFYEDFKKLARERIDPEEFDNLGDYQEWIRAFNKNPVQILVLIKE